MSHHNPNQFYEVLQTVRLTAAVLYDRGRSEDRKHEDLAQDLAPLYARRDALVAEAIEKNLPGVIAAIRQLQADSRSHLEAARYLQEKAQDARENADILMRSLKADLKKNGATERMEGDYMVTLIGDEVTIR